MTPRSRIEAAWCVPRNWYLKLRGVLNQADLRSHPSVNLLARLQTVDCRHALIAPEPIHSGATEKRIAAQANSVGIIYELGTDITSSDAGYDAGLPQFGQPEVRHMPISEARPAALILRRSAFGYAPEPALSAAKGQPQDDNFPR